MIENQWSIEVGLGWAPALRFYERKYQIIRSLQDQGLAVAFREAPGGEIAVRLGDAAHEIRVMATGLSVGGAGPQADQGRLLAAASTALDEVQPKALASIRVGMQFVVPLDAASYDSARRGAAANLMGPWVGEVGLGDFSLVFDADDTESLLHLNCEFGIVNRHEVSDRMGRHVGRMQSMGPGLPVEWSGFDPPPIALFADCHWNPHDPADIGTPIPAEQVARWLDRAESSAGRFIAKLQSQVVIGERL